MTAFFATTALPRGVPRANRGGGRNVESFDTSAGLSPSLKLRKAGRWVHLRRRLRWIFASLRGGGVNKLLEIGRQPFMAKLEAYYNVEKPAVAPDWAIHRLVCLRPVRLPKLQLRN